MDEAEIERNRLYPRMIDTGRGLSPQVALPMNFRELVPRFYEGSGREYIEGVARATSESIAGMFGSLDYRLAWNDELGLTNIGIGIHSGFDLDPDNNEFREHNLVGSKNGILAFVIAASYVSRLLGNRR